MITQDPVNGFLIAVPRRRSPAHALGCPDGVDEDKRLAPHTFLLRTSIAVAAAVVGIDHVS